MLELDERKKQVDALRARMQEELEQWADENEILGKGETLYFSLQVVKRDSNQSAKVKHINEGVQTLFSELRELKEADWEKILSVDWWDHQKKSLLKLKKRDNNSMTYFQFFGKRDLVGMSPDSFNYRFRKNGLPYRVRADYSKGGYYFEDLYFNIWVMPPKQEGTSCAIKT